MCNIGLPRTSLALDVRLVIMPINVEDHINLEDGRDENLAVRYRFNSDPLDNANARMFIENVCSERCMRNFVTFHNQWEYEEQLHLNRDSGHQHECRRKGTTQ